MPKGSGYGSGKAGDSLASRLKRQPLSSPSGYAHGGMGASPEQRTGHKGKGLGKYAGLPGGASGGNMGSSKKKR